MVHSALPAASTVVADVISPQSSRVGDAFSTFFEGVLGSAGSFVGELANAAQTRFIDNIFDDPPPTAVNLERQPTVAVEPAQPKTGLLNDQTLIVGAGALALIGVVILLRG